MTTKTAQTLATAHIRPPCQRRGNLIATVDVKMRVGRSPGRHRSRCLPPGDHRLETGEAPFTVTVTSCVVHRPPSCAIARSTNVPGVPNVTRTGNFPSGGTGGGAHPGVHGEPSR